MRKTDKKERLQALLVNWWLLRMLLASCLFLPVQVNAAGLVFSGAWARATVPGAGSAAIYGTFRNDSDQPVTIKKITTDVASSVMLHKSSLDSGMMRMAAVDDLSLAPGEELILAPGGMHMMLMGLRAPIDENQIIYVNILTSDEASIRAEVMVGAITQMSAPR
jgi:copper(I)-binding protein